MPSTDKRSPRTLGILLILAGLAANQWALGWLVAPDGIISQPGRIHAIQAGQAVLVLLGIWVLWRRPRVDARLVTAACFLLSGVLLIGAYASVQATLPPPAERPGLAMTERLSLLADDLEAGWERDLARASVRLENATGFRDASVIANANLLLIRGQTREAIATFETLLEDAERSGADPMTLKALRDFLAISYLRLGEQENCIAMHNADRCLFPIRDEGVHVLPDGSRKALEYLHAVMRAEPADEGSRWLLNVAYMTLGEYPHGVPSEWLIPPESFASDIEFPQFPEVAAAVHGRDVMTLAGSVILDDFDGGGIDIVISELNLNGQIRLFTNRGDGDFVERTAPAGLTGQTGGLNLTHADYDNDGDLDIFVPRGGWMRQRGRQPNSLLRNNGDGTFTDVTEAAGLLTFQPTQAAAWADFDNDGWLDLAIGSESLKYEPFPAELYRNNGDGTFTDVAQDAGIHVAGVIKGVTWGDIDNDLLPDLYVSRFGDSNVLYRNDGPGPDGRWSFSDVTEAAGVSEPYYSFPTWFWDFDNDGWLDLFVAGFWGQSESVYGAANSPDPLLGEVTAMYLGEPIEGSDVPRLYRNRGDGTFEDVTVETRLDRVVHVMAGNFGDLNNDGYQDLYLATGAPNYRAILPNRMFLSNGGEHFLDVTTAGNFGHLQKGHGVAFADLDNDGDQEVYVELGGWYPGDVFQNALFENPTQGQNSWITIQLAGNKSNSFGVGARLELVIEEPGGTREVHAVVSSGGSFGSSSLQQEIGLGQASVVRVLRVRWPSGTEQEFENVTPNRIVRLVEGSPDLEPVDGWEPFNLGGTGSHVGSH